jgi:hypothetical protein
MTREEFIEKHCRLCGSQRCYGEEYCAEYQEKVMEVPNEFREMLSNKPETLPTNRQWLESLTDKQLAEFLTCELQVTTAHYLGMLPFFIDMRSIAYSYTQSNLGIEKWLAMPQDYIVLEEE